MQVGNIVQLTSSPPGTGSANFARRIALPADPACVDDLREQLFLLSKRCAEAEQIIARLTMDHNSTPNYAVGFDMAQEHFAQYPTDPI